MWIVREPFFWYTICTIDTIIVAFLSFTRWFRHISFHTSHQSSNKEEVTGSESMINLKATGRYSIKSRRNESWNRCYHQVIVYCCCSNTMVWSFQLWVGDPNGRLKIIQEQLLTLPIVIFRIFRCKLTPHNTKSVAFTMKNYPISQQVHSCSNWSHLLFGFKNHSY